jgi:hypothetical protein
MIDTIGLSVNNELIEMIIASFQDDLKNDMQSCNTCIVSYQNPTPNDWANISKYDTKLINVG